MSRIERLFALLEKATSQFHTVAATKEQLLAQGFEELKLKNHWDLKRGGKYLLDHHDSTIFAFTIGEEFEAEDGFRIAAAHGDFPGFRLKPNAEMEVGGYLQLNTETYGGAILSTWLDRPLSVAGRVVLKSDDVFKPEVRLVDLKKPVLIIPNLAIHFNREMNKGVELRKQVEMLPITVIHNSAGSNGMCAGNNPKEAIIQGLSEIVERYVLRLIYQNNLSLPSIPKEEFMGNDIYEKIIILERENDVTIDIKDCSCGYGIPAIGVLITKNNTNKYQYFSMITQKNIALSCIFLLRFRIYFRINHYIATAKPNLIFMS